MGVCAKNLEPGEVAWRCLDCEKDPTCIICKECFEKSDHTGHRVQLKRNVGGCCDCGDPEAWDENHFCSDHKGQHDVNPEQVLEKMPDTIKNAAKNVFSSIIRELKIKCMKLQNYEDQCQKTSMSDEAYKDTMVNCIKLMFEFLASRINECPAFIYIIDENLNKVILDEKVFCKNDDHKTCCVREFLEQDKEQKEAFQKIFDSHEQKDKLCTCTTLDLCFQTNGLLDDETRQLVYDFFFKMFQSYHFKQCLTLSFAANFQVIVNNKNQDDEKDLQGIGVQVLTSDEMSMLIFKRPALRDCFLTTLDDHLKKLAASPDSNEYYLQFFHILHDIKYMARPESLKYCISETDWIERLIISLEKFYLIDYKKPRTEMVAYAQEGGPNTKLLNLEIYIIKLMKMYLKEIDHKNLEKNKSILGAFCRAFEIIDRRMRDHKLTNVGFFSVPLHRTFAYYLTRYFLLNQFDKESDYFNNDEQSGFSLQQMNRKLLKKTMDLQDGDDDQIMSSSLVDDNGPSSLKIDGHIHQVVFCLTKYFSFLHEVESRKWVYYGEHLGHFPLIYHSQQDRLSSQDLCLMQILLTCDNTDDPQNTGQIPIIDYVIDSFGLDGQLSMLINGLIGGVISQKQFNQFKKFDAQKMRLQLMAFLRFFAGLCLVEVPFLKQIFNRKDEVAEKNHHIQNHNSKEIKKLWAHALKREAVHLLIMNKVNTGIRQLKEQMSEIFEKDETFEESLFEISDQSRDIKNQVTFRLKDNLYPMFDPYLYVVPDQQSLIYQMYEQNQLKDKHIEEGLNDIVGDYLDHYKYATNVNAQIQVNLAQSKMSKIICPLLVNWLKYKDSKPPEPKPDQVKNDDRERRRIQLSQMMAAMQAQQMSAEEPMREHIMKFIREQQKKLEEEDAQAADSKDEEEDPLLDKYDETFLRTIVDANVGYNCLKLLVLILKMDKALQPKFKASLIQDLSVNDHELVGLIIKFMNSSEVETKMKNLLKFILDLIYKLDQEEFKDIATALGYNSMDQEIEDTEEQQIKPKAKTSVDNSEKVKKKKTKLLAKMKKAGSKYVDKNQAAAEVVEEESKQEESMTCAFCTKEMTKSSFIENPFGNFGYVQKSKLLYHASKQTAENQRTVLKNADLSNQFGNEEEQKSGHEYCDFVQEDVNDKDFQIQKSRLAKVISGENSGFMNPYTGSGCVVVNCKHFSHLSCLRDYLHQQQTAAENDNTQRLKGFVPGEFNCPICKCISNTIIPIYSLKQIYPDDQEICQELSQNDKAILDLYVDYLSEIILRQQGFLSKSDMSQEEIKILERSIILKDIKQNPQRFISGIVDYIAHLINIVDVKGLASFDVENTRRIHETIKYMVKWVLITKHDVLDTIDQQCKSIKEVALELLGKLSENSLDDFDQNVVGNYGLKFFALSDLVMSADGSPDERKATRKLIIDQFYKIVRIQVVLAALFRKNNGSLKGQVKDIMKQISNCELVLFEQQVKEDDQFEDMVVDIELPIMRKMFAIVCVIDDQMDMNEVKNCSSNVEELQVIKKQLGIVDDELEDFKKLIMDSQDDEEMTDENDEIKALLQKYSSPKFMGDQLLKFSLKVTADSEDDKPFLVKMPTNLLLMIPTFEFSLYQLPSTFMDLQKEFYKRKCAYCDKMVLDSATCLLTGKTMCWWKLRHSQGEFEQCKVGEKGEQKIGEGLNSWYTRVVEGGIGLFLNTSTGNFVLINNGASCFLDSPYRNKYGEIVNETDKRFDLYTLDEASLAQIKKKFVNFQIPNEILQARTNPDAKHKVYLRNIL